MEDIKGDCEAATLEHMSRKSVRAATPSIPELRQVDDAEHYLMDVLTIVPDKDADDLTGLSVLGEDVKSRKSNYIRLNRLLCDKLSNIGALTEVYELGRVRSFYYKQCQQLIKQINLVRVQLKADEISNADMRSFASIVTSVITSLGANPVTTQPNLDAARSIVNTIEKNIEKEKSLIDTGRSMKKLTINLDRPTNELHNQEHITNSSRTYPRHVLSAQKLVSDVGVAYE